jgi:DNA-binding XRE family transcriptional regulator
VAESIETSYDGSASETTRDGHMKINAMHVIQLRKDRSWTQEELAYASSLNLRTVQRIEKEGTAALHSKKALASAFDIDVHDLDFEENPMLQELVGKTIEVQILVFSDFTDKVRGDLLRVSDSWLEVKTKKRTEYVNVALTLKVYEI